VDNFLGNNMIKKICIISLIFALIGCTPNWYKPMGWRTFRNMPKRGSPGFKLGWIHGCQSGLGTQFAGAFYMTFYTWSRDVDITSVDPLAITPFSPDVIKIRKRYKKELKNVNWNDPAAIKKNFSDYNTIFWTAHYFCRQFAHGTLQASNMTPSLPGEERYDPSAHNLGSIWRINGRGDTRVGSAAAGAASMW
jgi:hypothetical protein